MIAARTVAGLALQLPVTERGVRIRWDGVPGAKYAKHHLVVVAFEASICALLAVFGRVFLLGRCYRGQCDGSESQNQHR
jgi:hypothetical protein